MQQLIAALEYIKYRWIAKGRHGIHSPFVYDYIDVCLKKSISESDKIEIKNLAQVISSDNSIITIQDFGVGSRRMGNDRKVSAIFRNSSSFGKYGKLLYQLSRHYKPNKILEFGTSLGIGTNYLILGNPNAFITTVEACENTRNRALEHLGDLKSIQSIHSTFDDYLKKENSIKFDLVFVDGHHDGDALLDYMNRLSEITHDETLFVLDDIRWSKSMLKAWNSIVEDPNYHLTIDHFRIGIVARRPNQEKEHFVLKL